MKKKEFFSGVMVLTFSMVIIQSVSMAFSVFVSSKAGAEAMGSFHLVMSVFSFGITVALSGVPLATTRLVSEATRRCATTKILKKALTLALGYGVFSGFVLFAAAPLVCTYLIKNVSLLASLKLLALSLPFIAVSAAVRGFFTGLQKTSYIVSGNLAEEFSYVLIALWLMKKEGVHKNVCTLLALATLLSSAVGFLVDSAFCVRFFKRHPPSSKGASFKDLLSISAPLAAGSYIRSSLSAAENIIIPLRLFQSGCKNATAHYGTIKAMALPVLTFPYVFLQSFISLLIPEISARNARGNKKGVKSAARLSLAVVSLLGGAVALSLFIWGEEIGFLLFKTADAGTYIKALSFLAVPMYVDSVTDGLLKGFNQQVYSLKINIIDSLLRIPALWILLKVSGPVGYIAVMYMSEILNLTLSYRRLKVTEIIQPSVSNG